MDKLHPISPRALLARKVDLGITDVEWPTNLQGITIGWRELHMRPHDMAKIGYLYLNEGQWDGEQIVPADWVAMSTREHIPAITYSSQEYLSFAAV